MPRKRRAGLSLMEVMIAVAVFVIAVLALISVRTFALRSQVKAQQHQQATTLALSLMAEAEARVKTEFDATLQTPANPLLPDEDLPDGYSYSALQSREGPNLQKITLTIRWEDRNGRQEYVLWTRFAR